MNQAEFLELIIICVLVAGGIAFLLTKLKISYYRWQLEKLKQAKKEPEKQGGEKGNDG